MKTLVLSCYTPSMQPVAELTIPTHKALAEHIGADHRAVELADAPITEIMWAKPELVSDALEEGYNVWWIDADAAVTNVEAVPTVGQIYGWEADGAIEATCDINGLNAGVFFVRNCWRTEQFFYACKTHGRTLFEGVNTGEQMAMCHFASRPPYENIIAYCDRQRTMNSYWPKAYTYPGCEAAWWERGDFILHLPGLTNSKRVEILREVLTSERG